MKRLFTLFALASIMIAGCTKEYMETGTEDPQETLQPMTFLASVSEEPDVKAAIDGLDIKWSAGDKIGIYDGTAFREFTLKEGAGTTSAVFEGEAAEASSYIAVYPYSQDLSVESDGIHGLSVPRVQTAGSCPVIMTAECKDGGNAFAFKNALAYVKFTPEFDCNKVVFETYGRFREKYSRDMCGDIVLARDYDYNNYWGQYYVETMSARVIANATNHVILNGEIKAGVPCYIAVAPRILEMGFKFIFDAADDNLLYSKKLYRRPFSGFLRGHALNFGTFGKETTDWTEKAAMLAFFDDGMDEGPSGLVIYDRRDFERIEDYCKKIGSSQSIEFKIVEDIDFNGDVIQPAIFDIDGGHIYFYGYGHKIVNYIQGCETVDGAGQAGLFYVKKLKYLHIDGLWLYPNSFNVSSGGDIYGGALASKIHCDYRTYINNCRVYGDISVKCTGNDQAYAGGLVGMADALGEENLAYSSRCFIEIQGCLADGSVTAYSEDDIAYAGGMIGYIYAPDQDYNCKIWCSRNRADISATGDDDSEPGLGLGLDGISAGGMVGCDRDCKTGGNVALDMNSCVNEGSVTAYAKDEDNAFAGGMVGCHDSDGKTSTGLYGPVYPSVNNCLNRGDIVVKGGTGWWGTMDGLASGIIGYCYNDYTVFRNCVDDGTLASDDVCAHISGSNGSYDNACYWTKTDSLPGIHDDGDTGEYEPGKRSGSRPDLTAETMNEVRFDAKWITRDGHLDLNICY